MNRYLSKFKYGINLRNKCERHKYVTFTHKDNNYANMYATKHKMHYNFEC
jgi:hypothetical protein